MLQMEFYVSQSLIYLLTSFLIFTRSDVSSPLLERRSIIDENGRFFLFAQETEDILNQNISSRMKGSVGLGWNWEMWWTYDGISGPEFWGVINPAFAMCAEGRRQSPINLDPRTLLHDPNLTPIKMDQMKFSGNLVNTGHSLEWRVKPNSGPPVNLSGGPLSYIYSISYLRLHFGERDLQGSEHTIANYAFPAELQLYGYNSQLYKNFSHASSQVYGVVGVAILIQLGDRTSPALEVILEGLPKVKFGGSTIPSQDLSTNDLLPTSEQYLTYEGSLTEPACHETVTWIIPNKPLYIAFSQMRQLRSLRQGSSLHHRNAPLGNNFRPLQSGHHRTVRTNIDFTNQAENKKCSMAESKYQYKANEKFHS